MRAAAPPGAALRLWLTGASPTLQLTEVQSRLLDLGSAIATPLCSGNDSKVARAAFPQASVAQLEAWLDALDARLPALRNFILPGGGLAAASLHAARAAARSRPRRSCRCCA